MATEFRTEAFEFSHGKKPRGTGCWAFEASSTGETMFSPSMSFKDAKAWAKAQRPDERSFKVAP